MSHGGTTPVAPVDYVKLWVVARSFVLFYLSEIGIHHDSSARARHPLPASGHGQTIMLTVLE